VGLAAHAEPIIRKLHEAEKPPGAGDFGIKVEQQSLADGHGDSRFG